MTDAVAERNKAALVDLIEAVDSRDLERALEAADRTYAPDYIDHTPSPGRSLDSGREGIKKAFEIFWRAFPDYTHEIHDLVAEGDRVVMRMSATGTHEGELMGIEPTGLRVSMSAIAIYRFFDGRIVERWCEQDRGILEQLRQAPEPDAPSAAAREESTGGEAGATGETTSRG